MERLFPHGLVEVLLEPGLQMPERVVDAGLHHALATGVGQHLHAARREGIRNRLCHIGIRFLNASKHPAHGPGELVPVEGGNMLGRSVVAPLAYVPTTFSSGA